MRVLFISPFPSDATALHEFLEDGVDHVFNLKQARNRLKIKQFDVILSESVLEDGAWMDTLLLAGESVPVVVTDQHATERLWAEVLNRGAYDLLVKPFERGEVQRILRSASRAPMAALAKEG
jgi:DNA-binding NtrC family response regulator